MISRDTLDSNLTLQDKIRLILNDNINETNTRYVPVTVGDLATALGTSVYNAYQTLYRLQKLGEIELDKDMSSGKAKIIGITVNKLEPTGRTYERAAERAKANIKMIDSVYTEDISAGMPSLSNYLNQKLAVVAMQTQAREAGLNPEETIKFEPNPYAEEGLTLLKILGEVNTQLAETKIALEAKTYDYEAAKRDVEFLKRGRKEETRRELVAIN